MDSPFIVVACICLEKLASAEVPASGIPSYAEVIRVGISLKRTRHDTVVGFRTGNVKAGAHIEAEGLESMNLIISRYSSYESSGQGVAEVVIKHRKRARADQDVRREVDSSAVSVVPVTVCSGVIYGSVRIPPVRILSRIEERGLTHCSTVRIIRIRHHTFGADIKAQMLVKEVRSKIQVQCSSVITGVLEGSLLTAVCHGSPVRHPVLHISIKAYIVFGRKGSAEDQVLPVGIGITCQLCNPVARRRSCRIYLSIKRPQFRRAHNRHLRRYTLNAHRAVIRDLRSGSCSLLRGDQYDSVRGSGTVDRC